MLRQPQMAALEKLHCGSRHDVNGRYGEGFLMRAEA
jgi:hypothetical protein